MIALKMLKLVLLLAARLVICDQQCSSPNNCLDSTQSNQHLYSSIDNQILSQVERASGTYRPCPFTNCTCFLDVARRDLQPFQEGVSRRLFEQAMTKGVVYQVLAGRLYRQKDCMFPTRCRGVEHFLKQLLKQLPDLEVVINVKDWPQVSKHLSSPLPVFSFSKTPDYHDILYPAWSFWDGGPAIKLYPTGIGRWDHFRDLIAHEVESWPWSKKADRGFFRGSRTSNERDALVLLSRSEPDIVDAAYTKNQAWKSDEDTLGKPPADEVPLEKHCHYKYLFNFRGVAASFRFKFLFLCRSLVLHVGDEWTEFFYPGLVPWVHYIPVPSNSNTSYLRQLLHFLRRHDSLAQRIADEGHSYVSNLLHNDNVLCYWKHLLLLYHSLLRYRPSLRPDFIDITD